METQTDNYYITCPYCLHQRTADIEDYGEDGHEWSEECKKCGKDFTVTISINTSWTTEQKKCEKCGGTGEINYPAENRGGEIVQPDSRPCVCQSRDEDDFSGATEGDR